MKLFIDSNVVDKTGLAATAVPVRQRIKQRRRLLRRLSSPQMARSVEIAVAISLYDVPDIFPLPVRHRECSGACPPGRLGSDHAEHREPIRWMDATRYRVSRWLEITYRGYTQILRDSHTCKPASNQDDLRAFLAVARAGSLSGTNKWQLQRPTRGELSGVRPVPGTRRASAPAPLQLGGPNVSQRLRNPKVRRRPSTLR